MVQVGKTTMRLPWIGVEAAQPWNKRLWRVNFRNGRFSQLNQKVTPGPGGWTVGEFDDRLKGDEAIKILNNKDLESIYTISATEDIPLLVAMVKHFGEDEFSTAYIERCHEAPEKYADQMHAAPKPKPVAKKKALKKKAPKKKKDPFAERLADNPEE